MVGENLSTVTACYYATGSVNGGSMTTGGVVGLNNFDPSFSITCIVAACYWGGTVTTNTGIGEDRSNVGEATKVEGDWTEAMNAMNKALSGTGWQYVAGSGDAPLTLLRQN